MKTPQVLAELEEQMTLRGLDEKSKDRYVQILWEWLEGPDIHLQLNRKIYNCIDQVGPAAPMNMGRQEGKNKAGRHSLSDADDLSLSLLFLAPSSNHHHGTCKQSQRRHAR